jgi:TPR repeat protein
VPEDVAKGMAFLERACESPEREQCATLAMRYRRGVGVPADREKALRYFTRACEAGDGFACKQADELRNTPAGSAP